MGLHGGLKGFEAVSVKAELLQVGFLSFNDLGGFGYVLLGARLRGSAKILLKARALATEMLHQPRIRTEIN